MWNAAGYAGLLLGVLVQGLLQVQELLAQIRLRANQHLLAYRFELLRRSLDLGWSPDLQLSLVHIRVPFHVEDNGCWFVDIIYVRAALRALLVAGSLIHKVTRLHACVLHQERLLVLGYELILPRLARNLRQELILYLCRDRQRVLGWVPAICDLVQQMIHQGFWR